MLLLSNLLLDKSPKCTVTRWQIQTLGSLLQWYQYVLRCTPNPLISRHFVKAFSQNESIMSCSSIETYSIITFDIPHCFPHVVFYELMCSWRSIFTWCMGTSQPFLMWVYHLEWEKKITYMLQFQFTWEATGFLKHSVHVQVLTLPITPINFTLILQPAHICSYILPIFMSNKTLWTPTSLYSVSIYLNCFRSFNSLCSSHDHIKFSKHFTKYNKTENEFSLKKNKEYFTNEIKATNSK